MNDCDVLIIGAGLSGMAAGIRLAHYGRKVAIMERHDRIGGMNSWYCRNGREFDVGLHAMTNFSPRTVRSAPLNKLLRQLRIPYQELELTEQNHCRISFPDAELRFSNNFQELETEVADIFPDQIDGFRRLTEKINEFPSLSLNAPKLSARKIVGEQIAEPLLREMLFCPLMYYGNAYQHDMDFSQFCIMFKSIFQEGLCRPRHGIRPLLELLRKRYLDAGGELHLNCGVKTLDSVDNRLVRVELDNSSELRPRAVLSCAGYPETMNLCRAAELARASTEELGNMTFIEAIFVFDQPIQKIAGDFTIEFNSRTIPFQYCSPQTLTSDNSEVICMPDNFKTPDPVWQKRGESRLRATRIANYELWKNLDKNDYEQAKQKVQESLLRQLEDRFGNLRESLVAQDLFTPVTIERYTGRHRGAVYGSPEKHQDGRTSIENLFVCGTDQGFLGIVGSLLSGVSMANYHFLS